MACLFVTYLLTYLLTYLHFILYKISLQLVYVGELRNSLPFPYSRWR